MDITVSIYERVKVDGKWKEKHIAMPPLRMGVLPTTKDRQGIFYITWYENRQKKRQPVEKNRLSEAVKAAKLKAWWLNVAKLRPPKMPTDPTVRIAQRLEISVAIDGYLKDKSGCAKTVSAHRLALTEFLEFAHSRDVEFIDEMDAALLRRWYEDLIDDDDDDENHPFTAANKVLKVNSFHRRITGRPPGLGLIKKSDYKRELASNGRVEIYTPEELTALFNVMDADEHLLFSVFREAALRKKEAMYLEASDLLVEQLTPEFRKCELSIHSKPKFAWQTKTGQDRNVVISQGLMDRLLKRSTAARPSTLLFPTATGLPDYHFLDKLQSIAKRAGIDPTRVRLKKFRATTATYWLRSKELGGMGRDIAVVRQQLGHSDYKSIESYIAYVRNEELAYREHLAAQRQN